MKEFNWFCIKCGHYGCPDNTGANPDPAYYEEKCSQCGAEESYLTDDIYEILGYYQEVADEMKRMRAELSSKRWIPVSEKMPEYNQR